MAASHASGCQGQRQKRERKPPYRTRQSHDVGPLAGYKAEENGTVPGENRAQSRRTIPTCSQNGRRPKRYLRRKIGGGTEGADRRRKPVFRSQFRGEPPGGCQNGEKEARNSCRAGCIALGGFLRRGVAGIGRHCLGRPRVDGGTSGRLIPCNLGLHGARKRQKTQQECDGGMPVWPYPGWEALHGEILSCTEISTRWSLGASFAEFSLFKDE